MQKLELEEQFSVWYEMDYGFASFSIVIAVGVDYRTARTIQRHWNKYTTDLKWDGTGDFVHMSNRKYCTNISSFEDGKPVGYINRNFKVDAEYLDNVRRVRALESGELI